jgi:hypothetical protein
MSYNLMKHLLKTLERGNSKEVDRYFLSIIEWII